MRPLLETAAAVDGEASVKALAPIIAQRFSLSDEDLTQMLPSGRAPTFTNRLHWAKAFLDRAHVLQSTRRGYFVVTDRGRALLAKNKLPITMKTLEQFQEYREWRAPNNAPEAGALLSNQLVVTQVQTPEEAIEQGVRAIQIDLQRTLLERFQSASPAFFERVVIDLLLAMGFGGGQLDRGLVMGKPGDGGIDGIVQQDELGLDAIYVQAKRYGSGNAVGRPDIQKFVGSMTGESASKGVFVTTSRFSQEALDFVGKVQQRIKLIDGERFAELAVRHGIGVRTRQTFTLRALDEDYFEDDLGGP
jgi:restriction system protein